MKKLTILFTALTCFSCEKIIEPGELPEQDPRLVLNCGLYTDSVITAYISVSKSIVSGKDYKIMDKAFCEVYEDGQLYDQLKHAKNGQYIGKLRPRSGKSYKVLAKHVDYNDVEGSTVLPSRVDFSRVERYDSVLTNFFAGEGGSGPMILGNAKFRLSVKDDVNQENFYALSFLARVLDSAGVVIEDSIVPIVYNNVEQNIFLYGLGNYFLFNDENLVNGNEKDFNVTLTLNQDISGWPLPLVVEITSKISAVSRDLFLYCQTANGQTFSGSSFFSEPVIVYNNINNGMGIVGGMSNGSDRLILVQKIVKR